MQRSLLKEVFVTEAVAVKQKQQVWFCEACKTVGSVDFPDRSDIMSVVSLIRDDHRRLNSKCETGIEYIRIVNLNFAWEFTVPDWARDKITEFLETPL
jgi:hypothetical protein